MLASLAALACVPTYRPTAPPRAQAGEVGATLSDIELDEGFLTASVSVRVEAPAGALLTNAFLASTATPPCEGGEPVTEVVVDGQEEYRVGPADVSGAAHTLTLRFARPPPSGWQQVEVAIDLELLAPARRCARLSVSGLSGKDWHGGLRPL